MRISASVVVCNRRLATLDMARRRAEKSYLSLGFVSKLKDKIFFLHQTMRNPAGVKYQAYGNVLSVFDKFLKDGKMTIRLKEPEVDLIIQGEPKKVQDFYRLLKFSLKNEPTIIGKLSNLMAAPTKVISEPTSYLLVKGKSVLPNLPRSLKTLEILNCSLRIFDRRILRLQHLRMLNLGSNELEEIPKEIELIPNLEELILENNKLGRKSTFSWLNSETLRNNLLSLDLRNNEIIYPPDGLVFLKKLKKLRLDSNKLKRLPWTIGKLQELRFLSISNNCLYMLPGSITLLCLNYFDYSDNKPPGGLQDIDPSHWKFPSLTELSAKAVLNARLYYNEQILPKTLVTYLSQAGICTCGSISFSTCLRILELTGMLSHFCNDYICCSDGSIPVVFNLCRPICLRSPTCKFLC